jgi:hypothetical protein
MPVVIDEMTTQFDVRNEDKTKKLVAREVKSALMTERRRARREGGHEVDPSDPSASGRPGEGGC